MEDQRDVLKQLDRFLTRYGLKINFVAEQVRISPNTLYCFRSGSRLLSQRQIQVLTELVTEYEKRLGGFIEGGSNDHKNRT